MAEGLNPGLGLKQEQKQIMSAVQIQGLELLTYNAQQLDDYIDRQLLENPVLEPVEAGGEPTEGAFGEPGESWSAGSAEESVGPTADYERDKAAAGDSLPENFGDGYYITDMPAYASDPAANDRSRSLAHYDSDLPHYLLLQLSLPGMAPPLRRAVQALVHSLDEDGYLRVSLDELAADLQLELRVLEEGLAIVQSLDPPGVGARSLTECLSLQVPRSHPERELLVSIIRSYLPQLAQGHFRTVGHELGVSENKLRQLLDYIRTLEPRPAQLNTDNERTAYVVPDIIVRWQDGAWRVFLADRRRSNLRISPYYQEMMERGLEAGEARDYMRQKMAEATLLLRNIDRRRQTILQVASIVVQHQEDFLNQGLAQLKALTLKEVAEEAELHESTVCRAVSGKYVDTPRGVYPMRFFFPRAYTGSDGQVFSGAFVRSLIASLIAGEDKAHPLSDRQLQEALAAQGVPVARRTVAKYRDEMGLPKKSFRRR